MLFFLIAFFVISVAMTFTIQYKMKQYVRRQKFRIVMKLAIDQFNAGVIRTQEMLKHLGVSADVAALAMRKKFAQGGMMYLPEGMEIKHLPQGKETPE